MFEELRVILKTAYSRISGASGVTLSLFPVIQLCGDDQSGDRWWITDVGVQRDGIMHSYTIPKERFSSLDWDRHVASRTGVDVGAFREALETAQALYAGGSL